MRLIASPSAAHNTSSSLVSSFSATRPATGRSIRALQSTRGSTAAPCCPRQTAAAGQDLREFGHNGTYLVFRHLEQHVQEFSDFVACASGASTSPQDAEEFAARLVGRHRDGMPLIATDSDSAHTNEFTFAAIRTALPARSDPTSGGPTA